MHFSAFHVVYVACHRNDLFRESYYYATPQEVLCLPTYMPGTAFNLLQF